MRNLPAKLLLLALASALTAFGQVTAPTCNASDVQTAWASVTSATTTFTIPAGTCPWTTQVTLNVPSGITTLTIQGSTSVSCTGTAGTSGYLCTSTDNTVIEDEYNSTNSPLVINMPAGGCGSEFRVTVHKSAQQPIERAVDRDRLRLRFQRSKGCHERFLDGSRQLLPRGRIRANAN